MGQGCFSLQKKKKTGERNGLLHSPTAVDNASTDAIPLDIDPNEWGHWHDPGNGDGESNTDSTGEAKHKNR